MGLRDLFKPSRPKTLAGRVNSVTVEGMSRIWESLRGEDYAADMVFAAGIMAGAGFFTKKCLPEIRPFLKNTDTDIIAFEAMAFNTFAIRAFYTKGDQTHEDEIDEAFRLGGLRCIDMVKMNLSNGYPEVFFNRVFEYRQIGKTDGMLAASAHFTKTLFSIKRAKIPLLNYGIEPLSPYDLELEIANIAILTFAVTMPSGLAKSLKLFVDDANVLGR